MKRKSFKAVSFKTVLSLALCLVLCVGTFAAPAFAAGTVVVVGGKADQVLPAADTLPASSGSVVVSGSAASGSASSGAASGVVVNGSVASAIQPDAPAVSGAQSVVGGQANTPNSNTLSAPAKSVVVGPDGTVTPVNNSQSAQAAQNGTVAGSDAASSTFATAEANKVPDGVPTELFALVNKTRTENGVSTLKYSGALQSIADLRAKESAVSFGHIRPDGSDCSTAVTVDYQVTGENLIQITTGFVTAELMMETWMNSPTHKYNILLPAYTDMAVGVWEANGNTYVSLILVG